MNAHHKIILAIILLLSSESFGRGDQFGRDLQPNNRMNQSLERASQCLANGESCLLVGKPCCSDQCMAFKGKTEDQLPVVYRCDSCEAMEEDMKGRLICDPVGSACCQGYRCVLPVANFGPSPASSGTCEPEKN